jgi:hypothetical protein
LDGAVKAVNDILSQKYDDMWTFRCYILGTGAGSFHGWLEGLPEHVQAEIEAALEALGTYRSLADSPQYEALRGACEGLSEVIIDVPKTPEERNGGDDVHCYRIIGFVGPGKREFTLLHGFVKENKNSDYGHACRAARAKMEGVLKDGDRAPPCEFP